VVPRRQNDNRDFENVLRLLPGLYAAQTLDDLPRCMLEFLARPARLDPNDLRKVIGQHLFGESRARVLPLSPG
jgi:hypothetical protein